MRKEPIAALGLFVPIYPPKEGSWELLGFRNPLGRQVLCLSPVSSVLQKRQRREIAEVGPSLPLGRRSRVLVLLGGSRPLLSQTALSQRPISLRQSGQHPGAAPISDPYSWARQALLG